MRVEDLMKGIIILKETCSNYSKCRDCPLSDGDDCQLRDYAPISWDIDNLSEK